MRIRISIEVNLQDRAGGSFHRSIDDGFFRHDAMMEHPLRAVDHIHRPGAEDLSIRKILAVLCCNFISERFIVQVSHVLQAYPGGSFLRG